ncbi:MAG TPA: hypothetical protein VI356_00140 [Myxococcales bacterium]
MTPQSVLLQQPPFETFTQSVLEHCVYPAVQVATQVPLLQLPDPLVTGQSAFVQHCEDGMHAAPHALKPSAQWRRPPHAPDVHVSVPWPMGQSAFEQHCAHAPLQLSRVPLQVQPHEPAVHCPVALAGTPAVHDVPSGAFE